MDVLTSETCWVQNNETKSKWHHVGLALFNFHDDARSDKHKDTTPPQPNHTVTPTHIEPEQYNTRNKSTISRKLLKMDVLTFETCWALNNKASDTKLVYLYSTIKMMHGPINIRYTLITYKPEVRFSGIYITENLKWNFHTHLLRSSLSKAFFEVTKGSFEYIHVEKHSFCIIWMAFEIWYNTLGRGKWKSKTFRVQKRVILIISGANKCKSCRPVFKDYKIITVTILYVLEVLCYIKRKSETQNS